MYQVRAGRVLRQEILSHGVGGCHSPGAWMSPCCLPRSSCNPSIAVFMEDSTSCPLPSVDGQGRANSLTTWLVLLPTSLHSRPLRSPQPPIISVAYKHTHITSEASKGFRSYVPRVPGKGMGDKDQISISYYSHGCTQIFL